LRDIYNGSSHNGQVAATKSLNHPEGERNRGHVGEGGDEGDQERSFDCTEYPLETEILFTATTLLNIYFGIRHQ